MSFNRCINEAHGSALNIRSLFPTIANIRVCLRSAKRGFGLGLGLCYGVGYFLNAARSSPMVGRFEE